MKFLSIINTFRTYVSTIIVINKYLIVFSLHSALADLEKTNFEYLQKEKEDSN